MQRTFNLPDPGEGLQEAEIITWRVAVGDEIKVNDPLVEIETSKSLVELPSPWAGTITALLVDEGQMVDVGTPILELDDGEDEPREPTLVGYGPADEKATRRRRRQKRDTSDVAQAVSQAYEQVEHGRRADEVHPAEAVHAEPMGDPLPDAGEPPTESQLVLASNGDGVRAKPTIRKYAADLGVDLRFVTGTGIGGTVTRADVEAYAAFRWNSGTSSRHAEQPSQEPPREESRQGDGTYRKPIKGVRKATADNVKRSVNEHVHVTEWVTVDVTATMDFVERLKQRRDFQGLRISPLLLFAKAIAMALPRNPDLNTSWDEENQEIVYHRDVNLGIAAATPRGLMVPNIKGAQNLSLLELCQAINNLVEVSRQGGLQPGDYSGGTFTLTNVGVFGIDAGTPIINGNESAILCMGSIERKPWVVGTGADERIEPRWVTTIALSFDHRHIDGEQGSTFLADIAGLLNDPAQALLF